MGFDVLHVQSSADIKEEFLESLSKRDYHDAVVYDGRKGSVHEQIRAFKPEFVLATTEFGVRLAHDLSVDFGLWFRNGERTANACRDKFEMGEMVRKAGVRAVRQKSTADPKAGIDWIRSELGLEGPRYSKPVVVKPRSSAGGEGFKACWTDDEVRAAFAGSLNRDNVLGEKNHEMLVQEFLEGTEYVVDTVSWNGKHAIVGIWQYEKALTPSGAKIYVRDILLPSQGAVQDKLVPYARRVLDVLGVSWGAAHIEIMFNEELQEPTLVEVGARVHGGTAGMPASKKAIGYDQWDVLLDVLYNPKDPKLFKQFYETPYQLKPNANVFVLNGWTRGGSYMAGPEKFEPIIRRLQQGTSRKGPRLTSLVLPLDLEAKPGAYLEETGSLISATVEAWMYNEDRDVLESDFLLWKRLVEAGLFEVREPAPSPKN